MDAHSVDTIIDVAANVGVAVIAASLAGVAVVVVAVVEVTFVAHSSCVVVQLDAGADDRNGAFAECFGLVLWCSWFGCCLMRSMLDAFCWS